MEAVKNTALGDNRGCGCDGNGGYPSVDRFQCAVCGKTVDKKNAYADTYYQPLCVECLLELHKI